MPLPALNREPRVLHSDAMPSGAFAYVLFSIQIERVHVSRFDAAAHPFSPVDKMRLDMGPPFRRNSQIGSS